MLKKHGMVQSMSRRGNCYDNAVAESFFSSLKNELVNHCSFKTREEARTAVFEYIEVFYNRQRRHQSLDYVSPVDYQVWDKMIRCGQHAFTFDLETGEGLNCPGYSIERYAVREEDGKIFLRIDAQQQSET